MLQKLNPHWKCWYLSSHYKSSMFFLGNINWASLIKITSVMILWSFQHLEQSSKYQQQLWLLPLWNQQQSKQSTRILETLLQKNIIALWTGRTLRYFLFPFSSHLLASTFPLIPVHGGLLSQQYLQFTTKTSILTTFSNILPCSFQRILSGWTFIEK